MRRSVGTSSKRGELTGFTSIRLKCSYEPTNGTPFNGFRPVETLLVEQTPVVIPDSSLAINYLVGFKLDGATVSDPSGEIKPRSGALFDSYVFYFINGGERNNAGVTVLSPGRTGAPFWLGGHWQFSSRRTRWIRFLSVQHSVQHLGRCGCLCWR